MSEDADKKPKKSGTGCAAVIYITLALTLYAFYAILKGCADIAEEGAQRNRNFTGHGYMQMSNDAGGRIRIMAFEFPPDASPQKISAHGNRQPVTQPGFTQVFYYPQGTPSIPGRDLALAKDGGVDEAHAVIRAYAQRGGKWRYVFQHYIGGGTELIDCAKTPQAELCPGKL